MCGFGLLLTVILLLIFRALGLLDSFPVSSSLVPRELSSCCSDGSQEWVLHWFLQETARLLVAVLGPHLAVLQGFLWLSGWGLPWQHSGGLVFSEGRNCGFLHVLQVS